MLLHAAYEGKLVDTGRQAEFTAVFSVHNLVEEAATLILPLTGVQPVDEMFLLDGAGLRSDAAGTASWLFLAGARPRPTPHRITLPCPGGRHGRGSQRDVYRSAPGAQPIVLRVPAGASESQMLVKYGAQWATRDAGGERLVVDLGALPRPLQLHWYQPKSPTKVTYQAAYVWDLGIEANQLTAWLRYRVERGAVKTLEVDLPADLEVSSATAQRIVPAASPVWLTRFRLRDWYVSESGGKRRLHLRFPYPICGDFQVMLELFPRAPLSSRTALPLPSPRGEDKGKLHYLAYRTHLGLNAQRDTSQNLTLIGKKEFAPDWPGGPHLDVNFSGDAYKITPDKPPKLFLRLRHAPPVVQSEVEITVKAGKQRAEIQAIARVEAPNKDLAAIEWDLPSAALHDRLRERRGDPIVEAKRFAFTGVAEPHDSGDPNSPERLAAGGRPLASGIGRPSSASDR